MIQTAKQKIKLQVDGQELTATLNDSKTAEEFVKLLPLKLTMRNFFKREKFARLPDIISEEGEPVEVFARGQIGYWAPGPDLSIFFREEGQPIPHSMYLIGELDGGAELFSTPGTARVIINIV